jgi:hypothetical protein
MNDFRLKFFILNALLALTNVPRNGSKHAFLHMIENTNITFMLFH